MEIYFFVMLVLKMLIYASENSTFRPAIGYKIPKIKEGI